MCLSFVRLTRLLARLMVRPRVTLLTCDTLSMVGNNVNMRTRLWVAFDNKYLSSRHESHDSNISSGTLEYFLLMAFHTLSLLHFSLLHFPLPHFTVRSSICRPFVCPSVRHQIVNAISWKRMNRLQCLLPFCRPTTVHNLYARFDTTCYTQKILFERVQFAIFLQLLVTSLPDPHQGLCPWTSLRPPMPLQNWTP